MSDTVQVGRLALRQEGDDWVAYYADKNTMLDAIELGRIRMAIVVKSQELKEQFMGLMRVAVDDMIEERFGIRPTWGGPEAAPESERSGTA